MDKQIQIKEKPAGAGKKILDRLFPAAEGAGWRERLLDINGSPHFIALGLSIGVFVACTPTIPLHTVLVLSLAVLFRASKVAAFTGSWLANPATIPVFYYGSYKIGGAIWGWPIEWSPKGLSLKEIVSLGWEFALEMITGGLILGIVPALAAYFVCRFLVSAARKKRESAPVK